MRRYWSHFKHNPPESYGDCFAACMRSVIGDAGFPHVLHDGCGPDKQRSRTDEYLRGRGFAFVETPLQVTDIEQALRLGCHYTRFSGIHWLLSGNTLKKTGHYVVCKAAQVVHNPTKGIEIVAPHETGVFWMGIIALRI